MSVSFHRFGNFFPGTGAMQDIGVHTGKNYCLNIPLQEGIDDESFFSIYKNIISKVMEFYQPDVVVLQCGADSLSGDPLGSFNLTLNGHGACVDFLKRFSVPLLVLGGGGYKAHNVARCWAYETGILLDVKLPDEIPHNMYYSYFGPDFKLHIKADNKENLNSKRYLENITSYIYDVLREIPHAPSVQYSHNIP